LIDATLCQIGLQIWGRRSLLVHDEKPIRHSRTERPFRIGKDDDEHGVSSVKEESDSRLITLSTTFMAGEEVR
jgi:hypothetical protein